MRVVEVNNYDLPGSAWNGYELHLQLLKQGIEANQVVLDKYSNMESVIALNVDKVLQRQIMNFERKYSLSNLLYSKASELEELEVFQKADVVHYHFLNMGVASLLDYPKLMNQKKSVWTVHDPWIVTGNCVHPLECNKWLTGCNNCDRSEDEYIGMEGDNASFMYQVKKEILREVNPYIIVSTDLMRRYLEKSPLTKHFDKIHVIPFGLEILEISFERSSMCRKKHGISETDLVIGFRKDEKKIKGTEFLYKSLDCIMERDGIVLACMGNADIPKSIREKYRIIDFGWVDKKEEKQEFYDLIDLFVMPSLAESFGMMAVEAMAAGKTVMSFEGTVLEEVTYAPECGIIVPYLDFNKMAEKIVHLEKNREELIRRGRLGHKIAKEKYSMEQYVNQHIKLYEEICESEG
ncbi:MAG: glycosyltransferase [Lachnospiraceae bacterium]|nr:glycosyltransferase [Lachnospiraceae bacterium]